MQQTWWFFKLIEAFLGSFAMYFHVKGFREIEPLPHNMFYCGTFFGFTLFALFGCLSISIGAAPSLVMEALVSSFGAVMHIIASLLSMADAENDFHLMYLSDFEEPEHPFFYYCKAQSIGALACGSLYLLHCILAIDKLLIHEDAAAAYLDDEDNAEIRPLKVYIFGKNVHGQLEEYAWFRHLGGQQRKSHV